jgi:hypothetical protein
VSRARAAGAGPAAGAGRRLGTGAAALLAASLAGCGALEPRPAGAQVNLSGFSSAFREGYAEGCASATSRERRRDQSRFGADADYAMGWNDGYAACAKRR